MRPVYVEGRVPTSGGRTYALSQGGLLDSEEQGLVFGESLPKGLRLG